MREQQVKRPGDSRELVCSRNRQQAGVLGGEVAKESSQLPQSLVDTAASGFHSAQAGFIQGSYLYIVL